MRVLFSGISLLMLFAIPAYPQTSQLRAGEAVVLAREDGTGLVMVSNDNPVMRFVEVDGDVVAVRLTPIDRTGAEIGGGRLIMVGAREERVIRLRDEFPTEVLLNTDLRVEVLQGRGRVMLSSTEEYGRGLRPQSNATISRRRAVRPPEPTPTSRALIDQAEAAGTINSETALLYRVYDIFSDARLPQQYRGDDSSIWEGMYLREVVNRYPALSAATQAAVAPFLIPPAYKISWASAQLAEQSVSTVPPNCQSTLDETWDSVATSNGLVRVWFKLPSDAARATALAGTIDITIWPGLSALMKSHLPKPDGAVSQCNGGDSRLDLYLTDIERSQTVPYAGCQDTPAFIEMNRAEKDSTAIHEIMHAFQFSYPLKNCAGDEWWWEGSAMWAEDFVSPGPPNDEHRAAKFFLDLPKESLDFKNDAHEYGAYLLPFYVYRSTGNADFVNATWTQCAKEPAIDAFDHTVSGGFEKVWFDFVRFNLNQAPFDDYRKWDQLLDQAAQHSHYNHIVDDDADPIEVDLPRLSAQYEYYEFEDNVSSVAFWNGVNFNLKLHELTAGEGVEYDPTEGDPEATKGARVQALIKIADKWTNEDWTQKPYVTFCRDMKAERIDALILIFSNSEYKDIKHRVKSGGGGLPVLFTSNMGCWQWEGTAHYSSPTGVNISTTATWSRVESQPPPHYLYQAVGKQDWNFAGDCSGNGQQLPLTTALSQMLTYNYAPLQSTLHRASFAAGGSTSEVSVNCLGDPAPSLAPLPAWLAFPPLPGDGGTGIPRVVRVKGNGTTMDDSYTFVDGSVWTWHFEAKRQ